MKRAEAFEFLDRTARGIAEMFGSSCETLVHDMGDPKHPILSIYNGHVSGRTVGSTMDILGTAKELDMTGLTTDFVNLYATTPSGQQIKSSTFHLIQEGEGDENYNLALGINFDYTSLVYANRILVDLMNAEADLQSAMWQGGDTPPCRYVRRVHRRCGKACGFPHQAGPDEDHRPAGSEERLLVPQVGALCLQAAPGLPLYHLQIPGRTGRKRRLYGACQ